MRLSTDQFHDPFEGMPLIGHKNILGPIGVPHLSHYFRDLLIPSTLLTKSTVRHTCAADRAIKTELSSRSVSVKMRPQNQQFRNLACLQIKTRQSNWAGFV